MEARVCFFSLYRNFRPLPNPYPLPILPSISISLSPSFPSFAHITTNMQKFYMMMAIGAALQLTTQGAPIAAPVSVCSTT